MWKFSKLSLTANDVIQFSWNLWFVPKKHDVIALLSNHVNFIFTEQSFSSYQNVLFSMRSLNESLRLTCLEKKKKSSYVALAEDHVLPLTFMDSWYQWHAPQWLEGNFRFWVMLIKYKNIHWTPTSGRTTQNRIASPPLFCLKDQHRLPWEGDFPTEPGHTVA